MNRKFSFAIGWLVVLLLFTGCSHSIEQKAQTPVSELLKYKDSYVGDNSAVGNILAKLEGGQYIRQFSLQTQNQPYGIEVYYGIREAVDSKVFDQYFSEDKAKEVFLNTSTTLFALVKNVDDVTIHLETPVKRTFHITREEMETFYGKDMRSLADSEAVWNQEVIQKTILSKERVNLFFEEHDIGVQ